MSRQQAMQWLGGVWVVIFLCPTLLVTAQSVAGKYGNDGTAVASWLIGQLTPVSSILLAAIFAESTARWRNGPAHKFRFFAALSMSVMQGVAILAVLLTEPLLPLSLFEMFDKTSILLSAIQGFAVASVGAVIFEGR